jgi:hypothetical protein
VWNDDRFGDGDVTPAENDFDRKDHSVPASIPPGFQAGARRAARKTPSSCTASAAASVTGA